MQRNEDKEEKLSKVEREQERARREARRLNYEYRPTAVRDAAYASRLSAGFRMMEGR